MVKLATNRFKTSVNSTIKGAGFNNLIPLTSMIGIKVSDGKLKLLTTDMTNKLCVIIDKVSGDDMDITIEADKFSKLISKMTSEDVTLDIKDDILIVKGNGTYKIPLVSDEDGPVKFADLNVDENLTNEVLLTSIMSAYNLNKSALAVTVERPELTGYYIDREMVVTTNEEVVTLNEFNMLDLDKPVLLSAQLMQLLTLNSTEKIKWGLDDKSGVITFVSDDIIISGPVMDMVEDYPVDALKSYLHESFTSSCKLSRDLLISVFDRLSLFIEPYDKNGALLSFGRTGLTITSKNQDSVVEVLNYIESKDFTNFSCLVDTELLSKQLKACPESTVTLHYGNENALKLVDGKVTNVIALLEEC